MKFCLFVHSNLVICEEFDIHLPRKLKHFIPARAQSELKNLPTHCYTYKLYQKDGAHDKSVSRMCFDFQLQHKNVYDWKLKSHPCNNGCKCFPIQIDSGNC